MIGGLSDQIREQQTLKGSEMKLEVKTSVTFTGMADPAGREVEQKYPLVSHKSIKNIF